MNYFHNQLMSARNQRQSIRMIKSFRYILSKRITSTTRRYSPTAAIVGVRPKQVAHGTLKETKIWLNFKSNVDLNETTKNFCILHGLAYLSVFHKNSDKVMEYANFQTTPTKDAVGVIQFYPTLRQGIYPTKTKLP